MSKLKIFCQIFLRGRPLINQGSKKGKAKGLKGFGKTSKHITRRGWSISRCQVYLFLLKRAKKKEIKATKTATPMSVQKFISRSHQFTLQCTNKLRGFWVLGRVV